MAFRYADPFSITHYRLSRLAPADYERHAREALDQHDAADARAIADLAVENGVTLPPDVLDRLGELENAGLLDGSLSFINGFVTGSVGNGPEIAGTVVSDFLVVGDLRDLSVNGYALATGGDYDPVMLGLALIGIAATVPGTQPVDTAISAFKTSVKLSRMASKGRGVPSGLLREAAATAREAVDLDAARALFSSTSLTSTFRMPSASQAVTVWRKLGSRSPLDMRSDEIRQVAGKLAFLDTTRLAQDAAKLLRPEKWDSLKATMASVDHVASNAGIAAALRTIEASDTVEDAARFGKLGATAGKQTSAIIRILGKNAIRLGDLLWTVLAGLAGIAAWLAWLAWLTLRTFGRRARLPHGVSRA